MRPCLGCQQHTGVEFAPLVPSRLVLRQKVTSHSQQSEQQSCEGFVGENGVKYAVDLKIICGKGISRLNSLLTTPYQIYIFPR